MKPRSELAALQPIPSNHAAYPARRGNAVRVLIDGEESLTAILGAAASAQSSVHVTVAFVDLELPLPGRPQTLIEFFADLSRRGIDVRMLFWRSEYAGIGSFRGEAGELETLRAAGVRTRMRWDRVPDGCHHQKSYIIDDAIAFVGGINLTREALSSQRHDSRGFHDLFVELRGPAVADVAHNFVQRWNQASETLRDGAAYPSIEEAGELDLPVPPGQHEARGATTLQVVRTIGKRLYRGPAGWPDESSLDLRAGERSIAVTVAGLIAQARREIYIENQFLMDPDTILALAAAAERGVESVIVVPLEPDRNLLLYPAEQMERTRRALAELSRFPRRCGLFGLVREVEPRRAIYVHSKLLIVDGSVMTLGSANLWPPSYKRDSELNVALEEPALCRQTLRRLWLEHACGQLPRHLADWSELGRLGRRARVAEEPAPSRIVSIEPASYYAFPEDASAPWHDARRADEA